MLELENSSVRDKAVWPTRPWGVCGLDLACSNFSNVDVVCVGCGYLSDSCDCVPILFGYSPAINNLFPDYLNAIISLFAAILDRRGVMSNKFDYCETTPLVCRNWTTEELCDYYVFSCACQRESIMHARRTCAYYALKHTMVKVLQYYNRAKTISKPFGDIFPDIPYRGGQELGCFGSCEWETITDILDRLIPQGPYIGFGSIRRCGIWSDITQRKICPCDYYDHSCSVFYENFAQVFCMPCTIKFNESGYSPALNYVLELMSKISCDAICFCYLDPSSCCVSSRKISCFIQCVIKQENGLCGTWGKYPLCTLHYTCNDFLWNWTWNLFNARWENRVIYEYCQCCPEKHAKCNIFGSYGAMKSRYNTLALAAMMAMVASFQKYQITRQNVCVNVTCKGIHHHKRLIEFSTVLCEDSSKSHHLILATRQRDCLVCFCRVKNHISISNPKSFRFLRNMIPYAHLTNRYCIDGVCLIQNCFYKDDCWDSIVCGQVVPTSKRWLWDMHGFCILCTPHLCVEIIYPCKNGHPGCWPYSLNCLGCIVWAKYPDCMDASTDCNPIRTPSYVFPAINRCEVRDAIYLPMRNYQFIRRDMLSLCGCGKYFKLMCRQWDKCWTECALCNKKNDWVAKSAYCIYNCETRAAIETVVKVMHSYGYCSFGTLCGYTSSDSTYFGFSNATLQCMAEALDCAGTTTYHEWDRVRYDCQDCQWYGSYWKSDGCEVECPLYYNCYRGYRMIRNEGLTCSEVIIPLKEKSCYNQWCCMEAYVDIVFGGYFQINQWSTAYLKSSNFGG